MSGAYSSILPCCPMCLYASPQIDTGLLVPSSLVTHMSIGVWPVRAGVMVRGARRVGLSRHRGWEKQQVGSEGH